MPRFNPTQLSVGTLFNHAHYRHLIIPNFQRPYAWTREQCDDLWNDISAFHPEDDGNNNEDAYFLGSIVVYQNNHDLHIIDGQQRITTLSLLFHAILRSIENFINNQNLIRPTLGMNINDITDALTQTRTEIRRMLWKPKHNFGDAVEINDPRIVRNNTQSSDFIVYDDGRSVDILNDIMVEGRIATLVPPAPAAPLLPNIIPAPLPNNYFDFNHFGDNQPTTEALNKFGKKGNPAILKQPPIREMFRHNECINYCHFLSKCYTLDSERLLNLYSILKDRCRILLLESDNQADSWDVFDIINNRGMQLSDSDIFKNTIAQSYQNRPNQDFGHDWQSLTSLIQGDTSEEIFGKNILDSIFRHYMQAYRMSTSSDGVQKSKEYKLRTFYMNHTEDILNSQSILEDLREMTSFLINTIDLSNNNSLNIQQDISVLNTYQRQGKWSYLISTFWLCYHNLLNHNNGSALFSTKFQHYIRYCTAALILKSIIDKKSDADIPYLCEQIALQASNEHLIPGFIPFFDNNNPTTMCACINNFIAGHSYDDIRNNLSKDTSDLNYLLVLYTYCAYPNQPAIIGKKEIEHILPKQYTPNYTYWNESWGHLTNVERQLFNNNFNIFIGEYTEHLGNKILLAAKANRSAGNNPFNTKLEIYNDRSKEPLPTLELNDFIQMHIGLNQWTKVQVDNRTNQMIDVIIRYLHDALEAGIAP